MKKCKICKVFKALAVLAALGFGAVKLFQTDFVQSKVYSGANEDLAFAVEEKVRLLCDLLAWPVHFVKALLP